MVVEAGWETWLFVFLMWLGMFVISYAVLSVAHTPACAANKWSLRRSRKLVCQAIFDYEVFHGGDVAGGVRMIFAVTGLTGVNIVSSGLSGRILVKREWFDEKEGGLIGMFRSKYLAGAVSGCQKFGARG